MKIVKENIFKYIEYSLFLLVMIFSIYLSIYGNIVTKMIPIVFTAGFLSRFVFNRPISYSAVMLAISLCMIQIFGGYSFKYNIFYSLYIFLCSFLGSMAAGYILEIYKKKVKRISIKVAHKLSFTVLCFFIGIFFNTYLNGDIISYIKAKNVLNKYITEKYAGFIDSIQVKGDKFVVDYFNYYFFYVSGIEGGTYKIGIKSDGSVVDSYIDKKIQRMNNIINSKFKLNYGKIIDENITVKLQYMDDLKGIHLYMYLNEEEINKDTIDEYCKKIDELLNSIRNFEEFNCIEKVIASVKVEDKVITGEINKNDFFMVEKYNKKFIVEEFDK